MGRRISDITGMRFGRLTVMEFVSVKGSSTLWRCRCDCGNEKILCRSNFQYGETKSCGCLLSEKVRGRMFKHGHSQEPLYGIWTGMKRRCCNPDDKDYINYGGRGIDVCKEWKESYELFLGWAKENGYKYGLTIDRIDYDKGYSSENCRWVTRSFNNTTRRNVIRIEVGSRIDTITGWAKRAGVSRKSIYKRYRKYGEQETREYILKNIKQNQQQWQIKQRR